MPHSGLQSPQRDQPPQLPFIDARKDRIISRIFKKAKNVLVPDIIMQSLFGSFSVFAKIKLFTQGVGTPKISDMSKDGAVGVGARLSLKRFLVRFLMT